MSNKLIHETSPYLLQHAHNPVMWYPWGEEALQKAMEEDKPILISIGYAACHWCHVMERESFESEETAALMNKNFINIKIDREERPDLDHIYMDAVQALTGSGGWPLNVFLTPERKPFYGGTYFPPVPAFNRISWTDLLEKIYAIFTEKRDEIELQAHNITQHLISINAFDSHLKRKNNQEETLTVETLQQIASGILNSADKVYGGIGTAPKFPQTFAIQFLLRHYYFTKDETALQQAILSIDKMICGGICDQIGGGFSRYSTDTDWFAPHFEKMLYDNALLIMVISDAYKITKNKLYAEVLNQTFNFLQREMLSSENGFYSALDADSEGEEGKYYTWMKQEIDTILGKESNLFCNVYNVTEKGNWEHTNILWLQKPIQEVAENAGIDTSILEKQIAVCKEKLFTHRTKRIRPLLDDKILLGWNALMITACCKAYTAIGNLTYLQLAEKNIDFLEKNLKNTSGEWLHTWKNGNAKFTAFLDDYAYLIQAYITLQEVTGNAHYLLKATETTEFVINEFVEKESGFFYFTAASQQDVIVRKKEIYDGATASGNSVMANNLFYLSIIFDVPLWRQQAEKMASSINKIIINSPVSFANWASLLQTMVYGMNEIIITGPSSAEYLSEINTYYNPNKIIQAFTEDNNNFPLLRGKWKHAHKTEIYLCKNYACHKPVETVNDLLHMLV